MMSASAATVKRPSMLQLGGQGPECPSAGMPPFAPGLTEKETPGRRATREPGSCAVCGATLAITLVELTAFNHGSQWRKQGRSLQHETWP